MLGPCCTTSGCLQPHLSMRERNVLCVLKSLPFLLFMAAKANPNVCQVCLFSVCAFIFNFCCFTCSYFVVYFQSSVLGISVYIF